MLFHLIGNGPAQHPAFANGIGSRIIFQRAVVHGIRVEGLGISQGRFIKCTLGSIQEAYTQILSGSHDYKMGAILCLVGSQAWVAGNCPWCLLVWIAYVGYTVAMMVRNENDSIISDFLHTKPMFWIEVAALTSTYLSLLILA